MFHWSMCIPLVHTEMINTKAPGALLVFTHPLVFVYVRFLFLSIPVDQQSKLHIVSNFLFIIWLYVTRGTGALATLA